MREEDTNLASPLENDDRVKVRHRQHRNGSESEMVYSLHRELELPKRKEVAYERELQKKKFKLSTFKAIVRQYCMKVKKVCNLAMASVTC